MNTTTHTPTRDLLVAHGAEKTGDGFFLIGGVEIASVAMESNGRDFGGEAYLNSLTPAAYANVGGLWKSAWIRSARSPESKDALRAFFADFEKVHGVTAGRQHGQC